MVPQTPLLLSHLLLSSLGTQVSLNYAERIPQDGSLIVVSNHRSFMDAPLLMTVLSQPIRFACHHYMGQVPVLREIVTALGCVPLDSASQKQQFLRQASQLLQSRQTVGIFPEGAQPMVQQTAPNQMGAFQRGFAHLALRTDKSAQPDRPEADGLTRSPRQNVAVPPTQDVAVSPTQDVAVSPRHNMAVSPPRNVAILPVAIAAREESVCPAIPLPLLGLFDPSEPLFQQLGWHPLVLYHQVRVLVGRPYWVTPSQRQRYRGKQGKIVVNELTQYCQTEIAHLLDQGCA